jgi:hypothetical protein
VLTVERGVAVGAGLVLAAVGLLAWIVIPWALDGFGELRHEYPTALALTLLGLGLQTVFGSFFLGVLTMRATRPPADGEAVHERAGEHP